ncbi:hypothetical protein ACFE04_019686 [Oxalis oulophora]
MEPVFIGVELTTAKSWLEIVAENLGGEGHDQSVARFQGQRLVMPWKSESDQEVVGLRGKEPESTDPLSLNGEPLRNPFDLQSNEQFRRLPFIQAFCHIGPYRHPNRLPGLKYHPRSAACKLRAETLLSFLINPLPFFTSESQSSVSSEPSLLAIIAKDRSLYLILKAISFIRLKAPHTSYSITGSWLRRENSASLRHRETSDFYPTLSTQNE